MSLNSFIFLAIHELQNLNCEEESRSSREVVVGVNVRDLHHPVRNVLNSG